MELLANLVLGDRYQIISLLGRQTGRRTFLAQDLQTEQSVVLKLLLFGPDFTWDDLKLFEREAEVLKSLDLPTIPKYLDCFDVDTELGKGFVLVQTYIEAKSLQNWLDAGRTFSEEELISIAKHLLTILDYLHSRQPAVIHRDIKPSNILLGDRSGNSPGQVYLVDFGSVKTAANGSTITIVGTYGYMPPEQFGGHTSPASDLYALGATIICLATGRHPSELPHRDMQIDFVDLVNLSSGLTNLTTFARGGWLTLLFISPFALIGIKIIWGIVFALFGTRKLRIDRSEISLSLAIFGLRCFTSQTAPRQYLDRVELVPLSYTKDSEGERVPVPPHLNIWAGNKQFCLNDFNLTQPEQEWLVHELTKWLDVPPEIEPQKKRAEKISPLSDVNISSNKLEP